MLLFLISAVRSGKENEAGGALGDEIEEGAVGVELYNIVGGLSTCNVCDGYRCRFATGFFHLDAGFLQYIRYEEGLGRNLGETGLLLIEDTADAKLLELRLQLGGGRLGGEARQ